MDNPNWINFKKNYSELFKVDDRILDLIAVEPILQFVVSGFSNSRVASLLELDEDYVKEVSQEFLDFSGNTEELEENPLYYYRQITSPENIQHVVDELGLDIEQKVWYTRCTVYTEIRRKVDEFYDTVTRL
jgi:hypothetical protein